MCETKSVCGALLALVVAAQAGCARGDDQGILPDGGAEAPGTGVPEACNGVDDDGDGLVDESATGTGLLTMQCVTSCGTGEKVCLGGLWGTCSAPAPDADGSCPCSDGAVRPCATECGSGIETCLGGSFSGCTAPVPAEEACDDGVDNDCDGEIDEGCGACTPGDKKRCGKDVGECSSGTRTCRADATWGSCVGHEGPSEEVCDGLDNDCDGETDEDVPPDLNEYNDACSMARRLSDVLEGEETVTVSATLHPAGDEDWMWVRAVEGWHDCEPLAGQCYYDFTVELSPPEGSSLQVCLYSAWPADAPQCGVVDDPSSSFCTEPGETSMTLSWEGICMLDDSLDFVVVVREWLGSEPSCAPYRLSFRLQGPYMTCPGEEVPESW